MEPDTVYISSSPSEFDFPSLPSFSPRPPVPLTPTPPPALQRRHLSPSQSPPSPASPQRPPPRPRSSSSPPSPTRQLLAEAEASWAPFFAPQPTDILYDDFDEAFNACQSHAKSQGYAVVIRRSVNKDKVDRKPRRYDVSCALGGRGYEPSSAGHRHGSTRKLDCPFMLRVLRQKSDNDLWSIKVIHAGHNHDAYDPAAFPEHRILQPNQIEQVRSQTFELFSSTRAIQRTLRADNPGVTVTKKDVENIQRKLRKERLGDLTPTQAAIRELNEEDIWHSEELDDQDRLKRQVVLIDDGFSFWTHWHSVMMFDTTYNTNRFGMKLFQVNGITCLGTIFPLAYALTHEEDAEFFTWTLSRLKRWFHRLSASEKQPEDAYYPHVIITDMDAASPIALEEVFPMCQKQLCIWHIAKNILTAVKQRWNGPSNEISFQPRDFIYNSENTHDPASIGAPFPVASSLAGNKASQPAKKEALTGKEALTQDDFLARWRALMFAKTPAECDLLWQNLASDFSMHESLLTLLRDHYMPLRQQWAQAYTQHYRNLGHRTTSPCESLHASAKSLLRRATANLKQLQDAMSLQYQLLFADFQEAILHDAARVRDEFRHEFLFAVARKLSWKALSLLHKQFLLARASLLKPGEHPLGRCTESFISQMGLPCKHIIYHEYLELVVENNVRSVKVTRPLDLLATDTHWELPRQNDDRDLYTRIRDPRVIPRRRAPKNGVLALPPPPKLTQLLSRARERRHEAPQHEAPRHEAPRQGSRHRAREATWLLRITST